jgi:hypothetical protein
MERDLVKKKWLRSFIMYIIFINLGFFSLLIYYGLTIDTPNHWEPGLYIGGTMLAFMACISSIILARAYFRPGTILLVCLSFISSTKTYSAAILCIGSIVACFMQWEVSYLLFMPIIFGVYTFVYSSFTYWCVKLIKENRKFRKKKIISYGRMNKTCNGVFMEQDYVEDELDYKVRISYAGAGMVYVHPLDESTYARVMPGRAHSPHGVLKMPYVVHVEQGRTMNQSGCIVSKNTSNSYIPYEDFEYTTLPMGLTEEEKIYVLNGYLKTIWSVTNKEYQRRVWIQGDGPEVDDYDETICRIFDDGIPILDKKDAFSLSRYQCKVIKKFHKKIMSFFDKPGIEYYDPKLVIDNTEWTKVMDKAKDVLKAFEFKQC